MNVQCIHCGETLELDEDGAIPYHDWPKPTRQVCPGSKKPYGLGTKILKIEAWFRVLLQEKIPGSTNGQKKQWLAITNLGICGVAEAEGDTEKEAIDNLGTLLDMRVVVHSIRTRGSNEK